MLPMTRNVVYIDENISIRDSISVREIDGIYYIDTIEKDDIRYLLVHGDKYVPGIDIKSARK